MRDCVLVIFLCAASRLAAQDPFEIHIYEYEPMTLGQYSLEAHLNVTAQGSSAPRRNPAPDQRADAFNA